MAAEAAAERLPPPPLAGMALPSSLAETAQQIALSMQPDLAKLSAASMKSAAMLPPASSMVNLSCLRKHLNIGARAQGFDSCSK